jgi:three-Cys-motif partner protein
LTRHEAHFEKFQPHTRLKHAILDTYIIAWAMKLLMRRGAGSRVVIVDAFAGSGRDRTGYDGSPVIAVKRARQAMERVRSLRPQLGDPQIPVFAIEKHASRFRALQETLEPYARETPNLVHVLRGELSDHIDSILRLSGDDPTFYFLDPFGIKGLDATTYPKALAGQRNEIFALFANIGAVRLHGLVTSERADASSAVAAIQDAPSLFPEDDAAAIVSAAESAARVNEALDASVPASREHLTRALGGEAWVTALEQASPPDRADTFLRLFQEALSRAGAKYVLTVPMRNQFGQPVYALVHASKSAAGFVTMKEAVSSGLRQPDLSEDARNAIKNDLAVDIPSLVETLGRVLAGERRSWAEDRTGVRDLILRNTPLFQFQANELKAALRTAGMLQRLGRKEVCVFPSEASHQ